MGECALYCQGFKDLQFAGEAAATALAHRLMTAKAAILADWNDVLSRPPSPPLRVVE